MENKMFCYQCQETAGCTGCTQMGVCGKRPDVAAMQDLLVYVTKGLCAVTSALRAQGVQISAEVNRQITLNLFTTITNANFDKDAITQRVQATLLAQAGASRPGAGCRLAAGGRPLGRPGDHVHGQGGCALHRK